MDENVIVQLCDSPPASFNNNLSMMLTKKLREPSEIAFSMKFEMIHQIPKINLTNNSKYMSFYDIEIVPDRNLLIFGTNSNLNFFNLTTWSRRRTIQFSDLDENVIHEIVVDGEYLYLTTGKKLMKYNLNSLLDENVEIGKALIWSSSPNAYTNYWGLALCQLNSIKYAFVMDNNEGIVVFDSQTGDKSKMKVPRISFGYGIAFTDENEMIISTTNKSTGPIQIYTFNNQSWQLSREVVRTKYYNTPYGICYERKTKLIYLVDTNARMIYVFDKKTMKVVHEIPREEGFNTFYSVSVDPKNGHLYLPLIDTSIQIFK